jgi:DNA-binding MarR family transcriptional regulator
MASERSKRTAGDGTSAPAPARGPQAAAATHVMAVDVVSFDDAENVAEALWDLWRIWRRDAHPVRHGRVTAEQYHLLRLLQRCGPLPVSVLAGRLGVTPATATVSTRRLEDAGLVRRERQSDDQRVVTVAITERAVDLLDQWHAERMHALVQRLSRLGPAERADLGRLLRRVAAEEPAR